MANEKRLIDAHTLKRRMIKAMEISKVLKITQDDFVYCIDNSETVDAVEVVRCKDCKHYVLFALACRHENFNGIINMNGFCS